MSNWPDAQLVPRLDAQLPVEAVVTQRLPCTLAGLNQPERDGIQLRGHPASLAIGIGKSIFHLTGASPFLEGKYNRLANRPNRLAE